MKKIFLILALISLKQAPEPLACAFMETDKSLIRSIKQRNAIATKEAQEVLNFCDKKYKVDKGISRVCSQVQEDFELTESPQEKTFLGEGTNGRVIAFRNKEGQPFAVKILSFEDYISGQFKLEFSAFSQAQNIQVTSVAVQSNLVKAVPREKNQVFLQAGTDLTSFFAKKIQDFKLKRVPGFLAKKVLHYWEKLSKEVGINNRIKKALANLPGSVATYDSCNMDSRLNAYIFMKRLGPSLSEVRTACRHSLYGTPIRDKVPRYLNMFFTVAVLHGADITLCDIKLENILLGLDFDPRKVYFTDFGVSTFQKVCSTWTDGYAPVEAFFFDYQETSFEETTERGARVVQQFDAFSLSIVMCGFEMNFEDFTDIMDTKYSKVGAITENYQEENKSSQPDEREKAKKNYEQSWKTYNENLLKSVKRILEQKNYSFPEQKTGSGSQQPAYWEAIQELINKIILGLMATSFETRLSVKEALYLFYVLSQLVTEKTLALTDDDAIYDEIKALEDAKILFTNPEILQNAMNGKYDPAQLPKISPKNLQPKIEPLANQVKLTAQKKPVVSGKGANDKKPAQLRNFPNVAQSPQQSQVVVEPKMNDDTKYIDQITALLKRIKLPGYTTAFESVKTALGATAQSRLI